MTVQTSDKQRPATLDGANIQARKEEEEEMEKVRRPPPARSSVPMHAQKEASDPIQLIQSRAFYI